MAQPPPASLPPPPPLSVAALQLETRPIPTAENLAHIDALLDTECRRLGVIRWDEGRPAATGSRAGGGGGGGDSGSVHLDILVLPEIFNCGYQMNERACYGAESLQDASRSPSLAALAHWARRYRCYAVATLLEATADGHIYNSLVLAAPDGNFITRPASSGSGSSGSSCSSGGSSGGSSGASASGSSSTHSLALVRKHRASSLEGFVFRSAGAAGRGGESEAHVVEIDAAPLLHKRSELHKVSRGSGGSNGSGSDGGGGGSTGQGPGQAKLRVAFSICYENYCTPPMEAIREAHLQEPLHLLISPFCAMRPAHDHPTFKWPCEAAERFAAQAAAVSALHAAKLRLPVVACHHTGPWSSALPRLLPLLPRDPAPISGPMLGCSAAYAPGGATLAQLAREQEGVLLVQLPLLHPAAAGAAHSAAEVAAEAAQVAQQTAAQLAPVVGAAAAQSAAAGPGTRYASYPGAYVVEPVSWHVRLGFPLMETLGSLSYHFWSGRQRQQVARAIAASGAWQGPVPPLDSGAAWWRGMVVAAAAAAAGLAVAVALRAR
ncbi:hypothetical protein COHA_005809 [Chlorella ohadii]|uniref:CN hydrolase domain-containing protein n=1 Tax=Chlorella ohadii TaxID=2649997 RepID=A0AAD5DR68_9CHLO|nr:hypothetical protein COHA_005809 [Chlorella ohadii]